MTGLGRKGGASDLSSRHQGVEFVRDSGIINPAANLKSGMVSTAGKGYS